MKISWITVDGVDALLNIVAEDGIPAGTLALTGTRRGTVAALATFNSIAIAIINPISGDWDDVDVAMVTRYGEDVTIEVAVDGRGSISRCYGNAVDWRHHGNAAAHQQHQEHRDVTTYTWNHSLSTLLIGQSWRGQLVPFSSPPINMR